MKKSELKKLKKLKKKGVLFSELEKDSKPVDKKYVGK